MKKLFTILLVITCYSATAQYFQRYYNVTTTPSTILRDEVFNSGLRTALNYDLPPDSNFLVSVGTSYRSKFLSSPADLSDRLRFVKTRRDGSAVPINFGYEFRNTALQSFHSSGNGVAEIKNATGTGGFVAVGAVTSNFRTGALAFGGSDALFARFNSLGAVSASVALNFGFGADTAWCVRRSNFMNNTFLICGETTDTVTNNIRCFVARVNANGVVLWAMTYFFDLTTSNGLSARCAARQLCEDGATGKIYVVGTHQDRLSTGPNVDGLIFCLSSAGAVLWSNVYDAASDDEFKAVRLTRGGALLVGGHSNLSFPGAAPMVNMLLLKVASASGLITWQTLLRATSSTGAQFDSKGFDVLERRLPVPASGVVSYEYYISGPVYSLTGPRQLLYRVRQNGVAINSYVYNSMKIDSLFALDIDSTPSSPGIFMFSSLDLPTGISSSHILKATYQGATCTDYCVPNPPKNIPIPLIRIQVPQFVSNNFNVIPLGKVRQFYKTDLICSQVVLNCNNPRALPTNEIITKSSKIKVYPNPANDVIFINTQSTLGDPMTVRLLNVFGQQVWQGKISGAGRINIRNLPKGLYFVKSEEVGCGDIIKVVKQ